ncbi:hypothetical protein [uncultured Deinococcus sp.]|uniref:hypothetical protein n=1 Tax=uncultured Deinococcus sp. TaxID=158789 RepID=UPI0026015DF8|nr:hypothetical protein [uncultured Deinococcus sp.]
MTAFKRAFTQATARYGRFSHPAHLYVAWTLLRDLPVLEALVEFRRGLLALAERMGLQGKYHETRTVAWMLLVLERVDRSEDWETFEVRNADLFDVTLLERFYAPDVLGSDAARMGFMVPRPAGLKAMADSAESGS